jgi:hypothetical protein
MATSTNFTKTLKRNPVMPFLTLQGLTRKELELLDSFSCRVLHLLVVSTVFRE